MTRLNIGIIILCPLLLLILWTTYQSSPLTPEPHSLATLGDTRVLMSQYQQWKQKHSIANPNAALHLSLAHSKGLSTRFTQGSGWASIDVIAKKVSITTKQLPLDAQYSAWMVSNVAKNQHSIQPESGDIFLYLGDLILNQETWTLKKTFTTNPLALIRPNLIVITEHHQHPRTQRLLVGLPSLFQKLYYNETMAQISETMPAPNSHSLTTLLFENIGISSATAHENDNDQKFKKRENVKNYKPHTQTLPDLVALGEDIFFNETFNGNGRTCSTCHPATNNFTIDPAFIAQLPDHDPLFVAEFDPHLEDLENSLLLRQFGLVRINIDGFEDPVNKHVMRAVPHTLALRTSIASGVDFPVQHTGWSGDGAPGTGSLREFSAGAVTQHFTRTLNRTPGTDFRLPTELELDALEAFMLSLGRQTDPDLTRLQFTSALAELGRQRFLDNGDGGGRCQLCHENGGANFEDNVNINGDTGVEAIVNQPARLVNNNIPIDGGFGTDPDGGFNNIPNLDGSFGNRKFNITTVIEAADTAPFFHNNALVTLESAVNFYNSKAFNEATDGGISPAVGFINLEATDVQAIAAFLRVINAVENLRWSNSIISRAKLSQVHRGHELLRIAIANTQDAIKVLSEGKVLHHQVIAHLYKALKLEKKALKKNNKYKRNQLLDQAMQIKQQASERMVTSS